MYYVYVLWSEKLQEHYVGYSADLRSRLARHNQGVVKATRAGCPWGILYYEAYSTDKLAKKREQSLKRNRGRGLQLLYKRITNA